MTFLEAYHKMLFTHLNGQTTVKVVRTDGVEYPSSETLLSIQNQTGRSVDSQTSEYLSKNWDVELVEGKAVTNEEIKAILIDPNIAGKIVRIV